jgi:hypothetical protein
MVKLATKFSPLYQSLEPNQIVWIDQQIDILKIMLTIVMIFKSSANESDFSLTLVMRYDYG